MLRDRLSLEDKVRGAAGPFLPFLFMARETPDDPAVILFTSGTEGEPKGVALSHAALLANVEQVRLHIDLSPADIVFNPLPAFHCFGLDGRRLMPLMLGLKSVQHPTPLQARTNCQARATTTGATILLSTDTFLSQYARAGDEGDLDSLGLRFAAPSACATKRAISCATNTTSKFSKAMASPRPRRSPPPIDRAPAARARSASLSPAWN